MEVNMPHMDGMGNMTDCFRVIFRQKKDLEQIEGLQSESFLFCKFVFSFIHLLNTEIESFLLNNLYCWRNPAQPGM